MYMYNIVAFSRSDRMRTRPREGTPAGARESTRGPLAPYSRTRNHPDWGPLTTRTREGTPAGAAAGGDPGSGTETGGIRAGPIRDGPGCACRRAREGGGGEREGGRGPAAKVFRAERWYWIPSRQSVGIGSAAPIAPPPQRPRERECERTSECVSE